jgi:hypothetical protein
MYVATMLLHSVSRTCNRLAASTDNGQATDEQRLYGQEYRYSGMGFH